MDAVFINQIWHSDVIVGTRALDVELWKQWPSSSLSPLAGLSMQAWTGLRTSTGREASKLTGCGVLRPFFVAEVLQSAGMVGKYAPEVAVGRTCASQKPGSPATAH